MIQLLNSKYSSDISQSNEYKSFRSTVSLKKLIVDEDESKIWSYYDAGPKEVECPLICLPPVSGTADTFFLQMLSLSARGYRIISIHYPVYWTIKEFCIGFRKFLDKLKLHKVHIFGASLGGFLAQKFVEDTMVCPRVESLILCNSFTQTAIFNQTDTASFFWMMPSMVLKKMVMGNYSAGPYEIRIANAIDFMIEQLENMSRSELASRLTLNCAFSHVNTSLLRRVPITIIDVFDECALSQEVKNEMHRVYCHAKRAHLKKGNNFPYISHSDEVNLHIQVHLRSFFDFPTSCEEVLMDNPLPQQNNYQENDAATS